MSSSSSSSSSPRRNNNPIPDHQNAAESTRQSLRALDTQRKSLEMESEAITSELTSVPPGARGPMGIDEPLVDDEGYPRDDIDVYRARSLRKRLAEIRTDYRTLMRDIERHLEQLALLRSSAAADAGSGASTSPSGGRGDVSEERRNEYSARLQAKPKPKFDPKTGKWVVKNWDGTVAGVPDGDRRKFDDVGAQTPATTTAASLSAGVTAGAGATTGGGAAASVGRGREEDVAAAAAAAATNGPPFARVNSVSDLSPAHEAGMMVDDLIVAFGNVRISEDASAPGNDDPFRAVAELVPSAASSQQSIRITVLRRAAGRRQQHATSTTTSEEEEEDKGDAVTIELRPRPWSGRGLLGCHIVPIS